MTTTSTHTFPKRALRSRFREDVPRRLVYVAFEDGSAPSVERYFQATQRYRPQRLPKPCMVFDKGSDIERRQAGKIIAHLLGRGCIVHSSMHEKDLAQWHLPSEPTFTPIHFVQQFFLPPDLLHR